MSKTKISWTDVRWNTIHGCSKVSEGCRHCYAERLSLENGWTKSPWTTRNAEENVRQRPGQLSEVYRKPFTDGPQSVFVNSMSDSFHELVPESYIDRIFGVMLDMSQHFFNVLTKRPKRMVDYMADENRLNQIKSAFLSWDYAQRKYRDEIESRVDAFQWLPDHIILGVSVEDKKQLHRIDTLRECDAKLRWLSIEPLLEPLGEINLERIDWIVLGGESESDGNYRPMDHAWAREIRDQCVAADIPFFFKQSAAKKSEQGIGLENGDGTISYWRQRPYDEPIPQGCIALEKLVFDKSIQMRAKEDKHAISEYAESVAQGEELKPIDVFFDGNRYLVGDGFHRGHAHAVIAKRSVRVDIKEGGQREAILHSIAANQKHSAIRWTNADKRRSVTTLLADSEWRKRGSGWIADQCNVSDRYVRKLKNEMGLSRNDSEIEVRRGDQTYTMDKQNIGKKTPDWTDQELAMKADVEKGLAVIANLKKNKALIGWAKEQGLYVYIGRDSRDEGGLLTDGKWGNPFSETVFERERCIELFKEELPRHANMVAQIPELKGKVLGCHCKPDACHGDYLAQLANGEITLDAVATQGSDTPETLPETEPVASTTEQAETMSEDEQRAIGEAISDCEQMCSAWRTIRTGIKRVSTAHNKLRTFRDEGGNFRAEYLIENMDDYLTHENMGQFYRDTGTYNANNPKAQLLEDAMEIRPLCELLSRLCDEILAAIKGSGGDD